MKDRPATRPGRTSSSSTATAASPQILSPTCRLTGRTTSTSKGKGPGIIATQTSLQPLLAALEVGSPFGIGDDGHRQEPQSVADDAPGCGSLSRLVLQEFVTLDRRRVRISLSLPALFKHSAGLFPSPQESKQAPQSQPQHPSGST